MREIKFRAWDGEEMRYEFSVQANGDGVNYSGGIVGWDLMQFTGLHDKNGKEIYEGDILAFKHHGGYLLDDRTMEIRYDNSGGCFGYYNQDPMFPDMIIPFTEHHELQHDVLNHTEVIGNIYENPELLKSNTHEKNK